MEQKPEGTPNPLNPSLESTMLDANPSEPMREEAADAQPAVGPSPMTVMPPVKPPRPRRRGGAIDMFKPVTKLNNSMPDPSDELLQELITSASQLTQTNAAQDGDNSAPLEAAENVGGYEATEEIAADGYVDAADDYIDSYAGDAADDHAETADDYVETADDYVETADTGGAVVAGSAATAAGLISDMRPPVKRATISDVAPAAETAADVSPEMASLVGAPATAGMVAEATGAGATNLNAANGPTKPQATSDTSPAMEPASAPAPAPTPNPAPAPSPAQARRPAPAGDPTTELGVVTNLDGTTGDAVDPTARPMQAVQPPAPATPRKNKRRKILAIVAVVFLFLAIGCGVAAALVAVNGNKPDPVFTAMKRAVSGEAPDNIMIDGTVDIDLKNSKSPYSSIKINLSTEAVPSSLINSTIAKFDVRTKDGGSFSAELSEIYAANGDLYLRVDGIEDVLSGILLPEMSAASDEIPAQEGGATIEVTNELNEVNCATAEECATPPDEGAGSSAGAPEVSAGGSAEPLAALTEFLNEAEALDGEWLRIPVSEIETILPEKEMTGNRLYCAAKFLTEANSNSSTLSSAYLSHAFVRMADEEVTIESQRDPIYKVMINDASLTNFANDASGSSALTNLANCLGYEGSVADVLVKEAGELPEIFVEIDDEPNFTRLYFTEELGDGCDQLSTTSYTQTCSSTADGTLTADFRFSYPANVNVPEPVEYQDFTKVMQKLGGKLTDGVESEEPVDGEEGDEEIDPELDGER